MITLIRRFSLMAVKGYSNNKKRKNMDQEKSNDKKSKHHTQRFCRAAHSHAWAVSRLIQLRRQTENAGRTIVGLWRVHYYDGGQEVFQSFDQWHRDGLEFEVSNVFGISCQGTWIHKGPGTVQLFHTGWNFDANGQLTGYFNEVQTVTVSVDGQTYEGTWDIKNYDVDGNFVSEQSGTLNADRLTVQTPL
jgi:hypothetical protein